MPMLWRHYELTRTAPASFDPEKLQRPLVSGDLKEFFIELELEYGPDQIVKQLAFIQVKSK